MTRLTLSASSVLALFAVKAVIEYTAGECPQTQPARRRYCFYPSFKSGYDFSSCCRSVDANITYTCPDGFVYNPRTSSNDTSPLCVARRAGPFTFDCTLNNGNGSYSGDNKLYASCTDGIPKILNECPTGTIFMKNTRRCEMACLSTGIFGISDRQFYTCTYDYSNYRFTLKSENCSLNTRFLDDYDVCLVDKNPTPAVPSSTTISVSTPSHTITTPQRPTSTSSPAHSTTRPTQSTTSSSTRPTDSPTKRTTSNGPTGVYTHGSITPTDKTTESPPSTNNSPPSSTSSPTSGAPTQEPTEITTTTRNPASLPTGIFTVTTAAPTGTIPASPTSSIGSTFTPTYFSTQRTSCATITGSTANTSPTTPGYTTLFPWG